MRFLIIDDDLSYIEMLKEKLTKEYNNAFISYYETLPNIDEISMVYDVILLDIVIGNQSGIEFSKMLKKKFSKIAVVFISNRNELIFQTQEVSPLCFIRKSDFDYDFTIFKGLLNERNSQVKEFTFELDKSQNKRKMSYITLSIDDIIYVECYLHEIILHTYADEYVAKLTLKNFLTTVHEEKCFVRIHRAYAINMNYVYKIEGNKVYMIDNQSKNELEIGRTFKKNFMKVHREFLL